MRVYILAIGCILFLLPFAQCIQRIKAAIFVHQRYINSEWNDYDVDGKQ